jgi:tetratricopeptide (TPR) repeat protein
MKFLNNSESLLKELAKDIQKGRVVFFVGAGISMDPPSNLPNANELKASLVNSLSLSDEERSSLIEELNPFRLEVIIDEVPNVVKQSLLGTLESKKPNDLHHFLAKCLSIGNSILTTNFDILIETAYENLGYTPQVYIPFYMPKEFNSFDGVIVKLHGSLPYRQLHDETCAISFRQFGYSLHSKSAEVFDKLAKHKRFLFLGYSGGDDFDIMPKLYLINFKYPPIWVEHNLKSSIKSFKPDELNLKNNVDLIISKSRGIKLCGNTRAILSLISSYLKDLLTPISESAGNRKKINVNLHFPGYVRSETLGSLYALVGNFEKSLEWYHQHSFNLYFDEYDKHIENYTRMISVSLSHGAFDYAKGLIANAKELINEAPTKISAYTKSLFYYTIARAYCYIRNFIMAESYLKEVSELLQEIKDKEERDLVQARYLALMGHIESEDGSLEKAYQYIDKAYKIVEHIDPELAHRCLSDIGLVLFRAGQHKKALEVWKIVLDYFTKVGKVSEMAMLKSNCGFACAKLGRNNEAIALLEESQDVLEKWCYQSKGSLMMLYYRLVLLYWNGIRSSKAKEFIQKTKQAAIENGDYGMLFWCEKAYQSIQNGNDVAEQGKFTLRVFK